MTYLPLLADQRSFFDDIHPTLLNPADFVLSRSVATPAGMALDRVLELIQALIHKHPALSCGFARGPDGRWQQVPEAAKPVVDVVDISGYDESDRQRIVSMLRREMAGIIRIEGPTAIFLVIRTGDEDHVVNVLAHHLVCDSTSLEIIKRELSSGHIAATAPVDRYRKNVADIVELADQLVDVFDEWAALPWDSCAVVPRHPGRIDGRRALIVPDIHSVGLPLSEQHADRILAARDRRTCIQRLLAPVVCGALGGAVPAAWVDGGRMLSAPPGAARPRGLVIGAVGWFALTGLVWLSTDALRAPEPYTWGLLHRIGASAAATDLLGRIGGSPGVWINVTSWPGEAAEFDGSEKRKVHSDTVPMAAARSVTFAGIPMAFQFTIHPGAVRVNLTWDAQVYDHSTIATLTALWSTSCAEPVG